MLSCLVVQHVEPECPFAIADALRAAGVPVDVRRVFAGEGLPPDLDGFSAVVAMGGPMSVTSDAGFPTRRHEIALLREALRRRLPVLGVCLGAQLLAAAAGGTVYAGSSPEIGWGPVELADAAQDDPLFHRVPASLTVLHWHGDTFVRPPGAVHLASSPAYAEQAFRCGEVAWGLQFHLEVDAPAVAAFVSAFDDELRGAGVGPDAILSETAAAIERLAPYRDEVLGRFAALAADEGRPALRSGRVIEPA